MEQGKRLNLERSLRTTKGMKRTRQKVILTHNPSEIDQNQLLLVSFPNLGSDDVIVSDIGRVIVTKLAVKFEGNEILGLDDFDVFACHRDLWKTESKKWNAVRQDIIHTSGWNENCMKL